MDINISANTLFHFTSTSKSLLNILKNGFYVRYSLENFENLIDDESEIALPMVSFCDIPLAQVKRHTLIYGQYAIGIAKNWGMKNKVNPVIYVYPNSTTADVLSEIKSDIRYFFDIEGSLAKELENPAKIFKKDNNSVSENPDTAEFETYFNKVLELQDKLGHFLKYIKPYEGKFFRGTQYLEKAVRFYDEREWRYTPPRDFFEDINVKDSYAAEYYTDPIKRRAINIKLAKHIKLKFSASDVRFIIVSKESEIPILLTELEKIFGNTISHNDLKLLGTRLISLEQILEDL